MRSAVPAAAVAAFAALSFVLFARGSADAAAQLPVILSSGLDQTRATIPVEINGQRFPCVLDTGTSVMIVSETVAETAGIAYGAPVEEIAPDGYRYTDHHATLQRFAAGGYVMRDVPALISSKLTGNNVLCGYDFFARVPTLIDRDRQLVTLFPGRAILDRMRCLPIDLTPRVPLATVQIDGTPVDNVVLDSGMVGGGALWSGVDERRFYRPTMQNGMQCGQNSSVALYDGAPAYPIQLCSSSQRPFGYNGIVETNMPTVHQLAVDYPNRRVCF